MGLAWAKHSPQGKSWHSSGTSSSAENSSVKGGWQCLLLAAETVLRRPVPYVPFQYSESEWCRILPGWQLSRAMGGILLHQLRDDLHAPKDVMVLSQAGSALKDHRNMCPVHKTEASKGGIRQEVMFDVFISNDKNKSDSNVTFFPNRSLFGVGCQSVLGVISNIHKICVWLNDGFCFFHLPPFCFVLQGCSCM